MSKLTSTHPTPDSLLLFADGELSPRESVQVQNHLAACWQCRSGLEEIQETISDCVRYRKTVFQSCFPSPPAPWCDIRSRITDVDATLGSPSFFEKVRGGLSSVVPSPRWWAPALATIVAAVVIVSHFRNVPVVSAAELLRKATVAADSQPAKARKIQIRTRTQKLTRLTGPAAVQPVLSKAEAESLAAIQSMFVAAQYDWNDPLSARSYSAWRDTLPRKTEEVTSSNDSFWIKTTTEAGQLVEASLKLRASDLRAVEGTLEFRNHETLELKEISLKELPEDSVFTSDARSSGESRVMTPDSTMALRVPSETAAPATASATIADELRVFATLHRLHADLGEPIEVLRRDGKLLVTGVGVSSQRQQQLHDELSSSAIVVEFPDPGVAATPAQAQSHSVTSTKIPTAAVHQMETYLGGRALFEQFADQTFQVSDTLMARVHALRRLAERFSPAAESELTAGDRRVLALMRLGHFDALSSKIEELQSRMGPVLASAGASSVPQSDFRFTGSWQSASEEIFRDARTVETNLGILLASATGEVSPSQALSSLQSLQAKINAYQTLINAPQ